MTISIVLHTVGEVVSIDVVSIAELVVVVDSVDLCVVVGDESMVVVILVEIFVVEVVVAPIVVFVFVAAVITLLVVVSVKAVSVKILVDVDDTGDCKSKQWVSAPKWLKMSMTDCWTQWWCCRGGGTRETTGVD
jgi:hypothetical protein